MKNHIAYESIRDTHALWMNKIESAAYGRTCGTWSVKLYCYLSISFRITLYLQFCVFDCDALMREEGKPRTQAYFMDFQHTSINKYFGPLFWLILTSNNGIRISTDGGRLSRTACARMKCTLIGLVRSCFDLGDRFDDGFQAVSQMWISQGALQPDKSLAHR